jgi:hypothetical protein
MAIRFERIEGQCVTTCPYEKTINTWIIHVDSFACRKCSSYMGREGFYVECAQEPKTTRKKTDIEVIIENVTQLQRRVAKKVTLAQHEDFNIIIKQLRKLSRKKS